MYQGIQYIGVELITEKTYGLKEEKDDISYRCEIVQDIINKALMSGNATNDPNILKIVVFPEFLFRGSIGAYTMESVSEIVEKLRDMVHKPQFENWLFVFGTIVGYSKNEKDSKKPYETYNFSFIQKGNCGEENSYVVLKKNKSAIDFERNPTKPYITVWNSEYLKPSKLKNIKGEQQILNYDGNSIINVDGLKIGIEICMDNLLNRINPLVRDNKNLDVHILVSCGIDKEDMKNYGKLHRNGVFILCDGQEGEAQVYVNRKRQLPAYTVIEYEPKNTQMFNNMFYAKRTNIIVFEPTLVLELEKGKDKDCRMM